MAVVAIEPIVTGRLPMPELYAHRGSAVRRIRCVCLAYVLRHPAAGTLLVDTGFHTDAASDRMKDFGLGMTFMFTGLKPEPFERQLLDRGIDPAGVRRVLMTHLHVDHTSGMRLLANARFSIARREWAAATARFAAAKGFIGHHLPPEGRVDLVDVEDGSPHGPFSSTVDVLGDGSVRLVSTPGHTPGHMSVLVRTQGGEALLAGDAAYTLRNVREQALPLITADAASQRRSLAELKAFADANPGAPLVPSHDPEAYLKL
jgi:glyoxylase-like metal-dependent hydrolase (beta-lactamase superfamily II)